MTGKKVAELGIGLALIILINFIFSFYVSRLFPDGWSVNASFFVVAILILRHNVFWGSTINLIASFIVSLIINPGAFFPVIAGNKLFNISISLLLDYFACGFLAPILAFYLLKIFNYEKNIFLLILFYFIINFILAFMSGVIIWGSYANGLGKYLYSLLFNSTAALGGLFISIIIAIATKKTLSHFMN